jgi:hypothetical protein
MAYGDYIGRVIADFPTSMFDIIEFAKDVGIDTETLTIIGFDLSAMENHPDRPNNDPPEIEVHLLAVRNSTWDGKYNTIGEYLEHEGELQVVTFDAGMNLHDFHAKYLKRFKGRMVWSDLQNHEFKIEYQD